MLSLSCRPACWTSAGWALLALLPALAALMSWCAVLLLADLIESAVLQPGDRLPPLRQLAADLGLAVGTVARAYRELESAGLISSRHGGGTRVTATAPTLSDAQREELVHKHARAFVQQAVLLDE
jgi:DNA-binding transcriptional regulator YhcF (GntR family)